LVPNAKTIKAMRESKERQLMSFGSTKELMKDLDAED
jgi:DNA-damage-inducible protein J